MTKIGLSMGWKNVFMMMAGHMTKMFLRFSYIHSNKSYPFDATAEPGYVYHCNSAARSLSASSMAERHEKWMTQFQRSYKDATEKTVRFKILKENAIFIDAFNTAGNRSYTLAINDFAELTNEEFLSTRTGFNVGCRKNSSSFVYADVADDDIPSSFDWREKGAVSDVKNQHECGNLEEI